MFSGINLVNAQSHTNIMDSLAKSITLTEFYEIKARLDSSPLPPYNLKLERDLDFGYRQAILEFDYNALASPQSYSLPIRFLAIVKNDTIIFGRLEETDFQGHFSNRRDFRRLDDKLTEFVNAYNEFYETNISNDFLIRQLTKYIYFSFGCGYGCVDKPRQARQMIRYVKWNRRRKIDSWLVNPNPELKAYAIWGIKRLEKKGKPPTDFEKKIINHLMEQNTLIYNCSCCLGGLQTPLKKLLN